MRFSKMLCILLLVAQGQYIWAQDGIESFILFDASCMKKYDYERSSSYTELAFWDFHYAISPNQTYIFRVLKDRKYRSQVNKLDKKPMSCEDAHLLSKNLLEEVNSVRKTVYIASYNKATRTYQLYQVHKIIPYSETAQRISYKDPQRSFVYEQNTISEGKDLDPSAEGKVLFLEHNTINCLRQRRFRAYDKVQPRFSEELEFLARVGLFKIISNTGSLELASINDVMLDQYLANLCQGLSSRSIKLPKKNIIKDDPTTNNKEIGGNLPNPFATIRKPINQPKERLVSTKVPVTQNGYYTVQEGDNLYKIAQKFNTKVDVLVELNQLTSYKIDQKTRLKVINDGSYHDKDVLCIAHLFYLLYCYIR